MEMLRHDGVPRVAVRTVAPGQAAAEPGIGKRWADARAVAQYVLPHLSRESVRVLLGTVLAFAAAGFGLGAALVLAAIFALIGSRAGAFDPQRTISWDRLVDLNTAGDEVLVLLGPTLGGVADRRLALIVLGAVLLLATGLAVGSNLASRWLWISVRARVISGMQTDLFGHLLQMSLWFHVRERSGSLISRLDRDIRSVAETLPVLFHTVLRAPFVIGGALVVLIRTSLPLTAITISAAAIYLLANFALGRWVRESFIRQSVSRANLLSIAQEALLSIRVVKAFGAERLEIAEMRAELENLVREERRSDLLTAQLPTGLTQFFSAAAAIAIALASLSFLAAGEITEQGVILFMVTSTALLVTAALASQGIISLYALSASAERVLELWSLRSEMADGPLTAQAFTSGLVIHDVNFDYGEGPVLHGISLRIAKGERIGLVGPSGAGKSTLADLLLRFYDPTSGWIEMDGMDIRQFTQSSYRKLIGVVSQETLLFNDTVRNNIAYGRVGLDMAEIEAAARIANAHEFIQALPRGYETLVGERGIRLSGGERQRIAIARAVVGRPQIIIFDEATSALDAEAERLVQRAIDAVIKNCTAVIVAHRLSTLRSVDHIIVLENGRIMESGPHEELFHAGGLYRRLYESSRTGLAPVPSERT